MDFVALLRPLLEVFVGEEFLFVPELLAEEAEVLLEPDAVAELEPDDEDVDAPRTLRIAADDVAGAEMFCTFPASLKASVGSCCITVPPVYK